MDLGARSAVFEILTVTATSRVSVDSEVSVSLGLTTLEDSSRDDRVRILGHALRNDAAGALVLSHGDESTPFSGLGVAGRVELRDVREALRRRSRRGRGTR